MIEQKTEAWFEARRGRLTASMAGAALGLSPFMTREAALRAIVREALGAEREFFGNVATAWGNQNEAGAIYDYEIETSQDTTPSGFVPFEEWSGCSPDALVGNDGGLEVKSPYRLRDHPNPVPFKTLAEQPHYEAQVQLSLYITGRKWWHFWQHTPHGSKLETILPDNDWLESNMPRLKQFWAEVQDTIANPEASADHLAPKRVQVNTPEAYRTMAEWDDLTESIERAEERKKDLLASIVASCGEKDGLFAGRKVTKVSRAGSVAYAKVVAAKLPGLDLGPWRGAGSSYWKVS